MKKTSERRTKKENAFQLLFMFLYFSPDDVAMRELKYYKDIKSSKTYIKYYLE